MFKLFTSSEIHPLAETLLAELQERPPENLLQPEIFVVQNYGMARWLSLFIAEREGIAANLQFKFPAEIYWQIMRVMDPGIPENLPSERIPMSWAIFEILQDDEDPELSELYQYVQKDDPKKREMRCWNLACRIADVFDQYLTYRPEVLRNWEENEPKLSTGFSSEKWQAFLWRRLSRRWKRKGKKQGTHRAILEKKLVENIDEATFPVEELPLRITVLGVSEMPEVYIKTLVKLSKLTDMHFYTVDAARNEANIFVQSLGKVGFEYQSILQKHIKADQEIDVIETGDLKAAEPDPSNFFEAVKHGLIGDEQGYQPTADRSIQVHSCHSARREIEVLYNQLLRMLDEEKDLNPSDILVLCPQMEEYAPEIEAIFGAVEEGMPEIPFHLAETAAHVNAVDLTFCKLLNIVDSRFKVTDILDLLDYEPIRETFAFTDDDVNRLEKWIGDNSIHWGISGDHKQLLGLPPTNSFTWRSGLNRMMAGYAMQPANDLLFKQIYPYEEIQGTDNAQLLGRFSRLLQKLFKYHNRIKSKKTLGEWEEMLNDWLSDFFPEKETYFRDLQNLREIIHSLHRQQQLAGMNSEISFRIVQSHVEDMLDKKSTGGGRPGKGVTFSGMVQMRNIPAKVICMIGMNDGVYPRTKSTVEFNLIAKDPQPGDRLPGKEDRQIFLENVLAARKQVYFSYVGQSNKKDVEYPPSVVLREFIDYLVERYDIDENRLIQYHRLQSFSKEYFIKNRDKKLFSYSKKSRAIAERLMKDFSEDELFLNEKLPEPDDSFKKLSINEFVSFFQHPAKFLLQNRLGIYLHEDEVLDEDRESFDLGGLAKFHIGQEMLDRFLNGQSAIAAFKDIARAKDFLPEGWPGDQVFDAQARQVEEFGQRIREEIDEAERLNPLEVDFRIDDFQIVGRLNQIFEHQQLLFRFGSMRPKDLIELWIKHLLFQTVKPSEHSGQSRLFTRHDKQGVAYFQFIPVKNYEEILDSLLKMYWVGLQRNILFYPKSSFAYAEKVIYKNNDEDKGFQAADREWIDRYQGYPKEGDDPYIKCLSGSINPFEQKELKEIFKQVSRYFWTPFFKELNKTQEGTL